MSPDPGRTAQLRAEELGARYDAVRARIDEARASASRTDEVRLVVVTKFHPFEDMLALARHGARDLGENRVQEAQAKAERWDALGEDAVRPRLVMIGHIQSKKTGAVARWADEVQSVDSVKVAEGLSRGRLRLGEEVGAREGAAAAERPAPRPLRCLVQLSLDGDTSRGGVAEEGLAEVCASVAGAPGLELGGIMVVPPLEGDAGAHFRRAAEIRERVRARFPSATEFSAGMSGDLDAAIAAGSTCVRVGTAILGPRPIL